MRGDYLLFPMNHLGPRAGTLPEGCIEAKRDNLLKGYRALLDDMERLRQTLTANEWERLNAPI